MKTTTLLLMLMLTASVSFAKSRPPKYLYKIISAKKHTLHFKVDKSFVGGTVELYDAEKNLIETDEIPHRHTMIAFDEAPTGNYVIKVKNGDKVTEINYTNIAIIQ